MNISMTEYVRTQLSVRPPENIDFSVGDSVIYTNDYGVKFERKVIGFSTGIFPKKPDAVIHLNSDSYWFPHSPRELTHI